MTSLQVPAVFLCFFTRHLAIMLSSGVPLLQALETLSCQPDHEGFAEILQSVCQKVSSGHSLSDCMRDYPRVFSKVYLSMIQVGEETGKMERSLHRLADWLERDEQIRRKLKSSLSYPTFVLGLCGILAMIIVTTVLPTFVAIFQEMNTPLPLITRLMILLTDTVRSPWFWCLSLLCGALAVRKFRRLVAKPQGAALVYRLAQSTPLVGAVLWHGTAARYCAAAAPLLGSGLSLIRALRLAAAASGNPLIDQDAEALVQTVVLGAYPSQHMAAFPEIYSRCVSSMLSAGEEAARSSQMFQAAGRYHQLEMESSVDLLGAALEPVLLLGVSIAVAMLILAIFLPLYSSLSNLV